MQYAVLTCVVAALVIPGGVLAQSREAVYRQSLLDHILELQQLIAELTLQLEVRRSIVTGTAVSATHSLRLQSSSQLRTVNPRDIYESEHYNGRYVAVYKIDGGELDFTHGYTDRSHEKVFELFHAIVGADFLGRYMSEFRVYHDDDAATGAFIDQIGETNRWILGVNFADVDLSRTDSMKQLRNLLIHEMSHVLIHNNPDARDHFFAAFWDANERAHAEQAAAQSDPFDLISPYYKRHHEDYVSEYAALSPLEDMAESFMHYVVYGLRGLSGEAYEKVSFFNRFDVFVDAKRGIERRLGF